MAQLERRTPVGHNRAVSCHPTSCDEEIRETCKISQQTDEEGNGRQGGKDKRFGKMRAGEISERAR